MISFAEALQQAREKGLDLVEVAPNADPPVCRLLDYGRFRYLQSKRDRETRKNQHTVPLREVRFRPSIAAHDIQAKSRLVRKLLGQGAKVKVSVRFRGREITHPELGMELLKEMAQRLKDDAKLEKAPSMEGRMLSIILAPTQMKPEVSSESSSDDIGEEQARAETQDT